MYFIIHSQANIARVKINYNILLLNIVNLTWHKLKEFYMQYKRLEPKNAKSGNYHDSMVSRSIRKIGSPHCLRWSASAEKLASLIICKQEEQKGSRSQWLVPLMYFL